MTKNTSQKIAVLKKIAIIPILVGLVYFFCIEIVAQEKPTISEQLNELKAVKKGKTEQPNSKSNLTFNDTVKKKKVDISITGGEKVKINGEIFEKIEDKYINEKGSFDSNGKNKYRYGYIKINNQTHVYNTKDNGSIEYFNKVGKKVDLNGKEVDQKANLENTTASKKQENDIFNTTEVTEKPEFIGGIEAFYKYIGLNYNVPNEVANFKLKGKIFAKFIIEKDGSLSNIEIIKDMGYGTGEEALRVLQNCPKWKPGKIKEEVVRTQYSLPISIQSGK